MLVAHWAKFISSPYLLDFSQKLFCAAKYTLLQIWRQKGGDTQDGSVQKLQAPDSWIPESILVQFAPGIWLLPPYCSFSQPAERCSKFQHPQGYSREASSVYQRNGVTLKVANSFAMDSYSSGGSFILQKSSSACSEICCPADVYSFFSWLSTAIFEMCLVLLESKDVPASSTSFWLLHQYFSVHGICVHFVSQCPKFVLLRPEVGTQEASTFKLNFSRAGSPELGRPVAWALDADWIAGLRDGILRGANLGRLPAGIQPQA